MRARLTKSPCAGSDREIHVSESAAKFRLLTCPVCNRPGLGARGVRWHDVDGDDVMGTETGRAGYVATVPPHTAKAPTARDLPVQRVSGLTEEDLRMIAWYAEYRATWRRI